MCRKIGSSYMQFENSINMRTKKLKITCITNYLYFVILAMLIIWILSDLRNKLHQIERKNRKKYQIDKRSYLGPRLLRSRFGLYWSCISFFHKLQQLKLQNYFRTCSCHRLSDKRPSTAIKTKLKHYFYWINFIKTKLGKILTPNRAHHLF